MAEQRDTNVKELAEKYVDFLEGFEILLRELVRVENKVEFFQEVALEMERHGYDKERIELTMKGAAWGKAMFPHVEEQVRKIPSILNIKPEEN